MSLVYNPTLNAVVCTPSITAQINAVLFGGATFSLPMLPKYEDPVTLIGRAISGMGMMTAPLAPMVKLLRIVSSVVGLIQAIATLNPIEIATKASQLAQAVADIAALVLFPVEMANMARQFLTMLIAYLTALQSQINQLITRYTNVNVAIAAATAAGNAAWLAAATCARDRLDAKVAQLNASLLAIGVVVQVLSIIICLVTGGTHIAALPAIDPNALSGAVFDAPIAALTALRDLIPNLSGSGAPC